MKASKDLINFVEDLRREAAEVARTRTKGEWGEEWVDAAKLNGLPMSNRATKLSVWTAK